MRYGNSLHSITSFTNNYVTAATLFIQKMELQGKFIILPTHTLCSDRPRIKRLEDHSHRNDISLNSLLTLLIFISLLKSRVSNMIKKCSGIKSKFKMTQILSHKFRSCGIFSFIKKCFLIISSINFGLFATTL